MLYREEGFRAIYRQFVIFPVTEAVRAKIARLPGANGAELMVAYGYIDHKAGLMLEVLAAGIKDSQGYSFAEGKPSVSVKIPLAEMADLEFQPLDNRSVAACQRKHAQKLNALKKYDKPKQLQESRYMWFLDEARDAYQIDDVLVHMLKEGLEQEDCLVRISGLGDHVLLGTLLQEPNQDFGYHKGETISFFVRETEKEKNECFADFNPPRRLKEEDLADGFLLAEALKDFQEDQSEDSFQAVVELLRDSHVWIPCHAELGEADYDALEREIKQAEMAGDLHKVLGMNFSDRQGLGLKPDILKNGDQLYLPVFSSEEAMSKYGEPFSKGQYHLLDAIVMARLNGENLNGIVVDPFTDPFVLPAAIFDVVEELPSNLETPEEN